MHKIMIYTIEGKRYKTLSEYQTDKTKNRTYVGPIPLEKS